MLFPTQLLVIALARPRQTYLISECLELLCLRLEDERSWQIGNKIRLGENLALCAVEE